MNLSDTERKSASGAVVSSVTNTRLSGFWLIVARAVWLVLVIPSLGVFVISLPVYYKQLQKACDNPSVCNNFAGALPARQLQILASSGFSISEYAALLTVFFALIAAIWCAVGLLIFWRRSDDWLALLAAFFLVMFNITPSGGNPTYALALAYPAFALPFGLASFLGLVSLMVFLLLFPNGRLVPRWMGLILLLGIIDLFFGNFPSPTSPFETKWPSWLNQLVVLIFLGTLLFSQIYRYRRVSTPLQRQQTKWIVLGVTVAVVYTIVSALLFLIPFLQTPDSLGGVIGSIVFNNTLWYVAFLLIPLSIGISILRYRLYDIDVIINRTLVYGSLTALLALLYAGLIFALQSLFQGIFHQNNDVVIVVSTLVIAALFQPLRHRLQLIIDRRFYRRKYDAARTLSQFSTSLRDEVDLSQLRESLVAVVEETMQPIQVSLWVRPTQQNGKPTTAWTRNPSPLYMNIEE